MNMSPLSANLVNLLSTNSALAFDSDKLSSMAKTEGEGSFANILSEALSTAAQADTVDKASALELLIGRSDDLSGLLIDAQKAELSLTLALQIRNKVIDAYNDIIKMQV